MPTNPTSTIAEKHDANDEWIYPLPEGVEVPDDREVMEKIERIYEDLESGKSRALSWEEYLLFDRLSDESPHLSAEEILAEIDRRYEARRKAGELSAEGNPSATQMGFLPMMSESEALKEASRRYHELRHGKAQGLSIEEFELLDQIEDENDSLSDEEIIEDAARRYAELRSGKIKELPVEEHLLATR